MVSGENRIIYIIASTGKNGVKLESETRYYNITNAIYRYSWSWARDKQKKSQIFVTGAC